MTTINEMNYVLAFGELSQDLLFHKIETRKVQEYLSKSMEIGYNIAEKYKYNDIFDMYKQNEIEIEYSENNGDYYGVKFRAQFEFDNNKSSKVIIYKDSIKELAEVSGISEELSLKIHLCHEFFHYYELFHEKVVSNELEPVVVIKLFNLKKKARINKCSEIAAHAFTKKMIGLKYLPNYYDYKYLINKKIVSDKYINELNCKYKECLLSE